MQPTQTKNDLKFDFHHIRTSYKKGATIFHEEDERDNAYIIETGAVEISTTRHGKKVPLVHLGQGEVFGETALLGAGKRTATAVALEDTEVFTISPGLLHDRIMHLDPLVGLLLSLLVNRYRQWRFRSPEEAEKEANADLPHEEAKMDHVNKADVFMRDLQVQRAAALDELRMAQEITRAIDLNQFGPWLQPIVSLPEKKIVGFEALVRWDHPSRGRVSPAEFIPVAERTHVVWDIDMTMLKAACQIVPELQKAAGGVDRKLYISVNLSGVHFENEGIVDEVSAIVKSSGIDPQHLVFEITESALVGDPAVAEKILHKLRKIGGRIALDDFGTGYSSLSYLHRFNFDLLKIDRAFVHDIATNRKSLEIVRAIVMLAKNFHLQITGEGIESDHEADLLSGIGCDYGQGYCFAKPMPLNDAVKFVKDSVEKNG